MTFKRAVTDITGRWPEVTGAVSFLDIRQHVAGLSAGLATETANQLTGHLIPEDRVLLVPILRGGALLYHEFSRAFPEADVCFLAMTRTDSETVECIYMSDVAGDNYDVVIYIDCVAGTAGTMFNARQQLAQVCESALDVAAVLCSSALATERLVAAGFGIVGFALHEDLDGAMVLPDLGAADAGDLFSSSRQRTSR